MVDLDENRDAYSTSTRRRKLRRARVSCIESASGPIDVVRQLSPFAAQKYYRRYFRRIGRLAQ